jgi:hypothetical protein
MGSRIAYKGEKANSPPPTKVLIDCSRFFCAPAVTNIDFT